MSLPSWERGLKLTYVKANYSMDAVAPLVGAWIEIFLRTELYRSEYVAPLVGAWIEMPKEISSGIVCAPSLPSWERGLKYVACKGT